MLPFYWRVLAHIPPDILCTFQKRGPLFARCCSCCCCKLQMVLAPTPLCASTGMVLDKPGQPATGSLSQRSLQSISVILDDCVDNNCGTRRVPATTILRSDACGLLPALISKSTLTCYDHLYHHICVNSYQPERSIAKTRRKKQNKKDLISAYLAF